MGLLNYWSNLHKKPFNTMVDNSISCVVPVCRLDDDFLKPSYEPPTDNYNTSFEKTVTFIT